MHDSIQPSKDRPQDHESMYLARIGVVVIVIAVLACLLLAPALTAIASANRAKDSSNALQIRTAVLSYKVEYGVLPMPTGAPSTGDITIGALPGSDPGTSPSVTMIAFYQGICGNLNAYNGTVVTSTGFNAKDIIYISVPKSAVDANGVMFQAFKAYGVNGHSSAPSPTNFIYFSVMEDTNHDGMLSGLPDPDYVAHGGTQFGLSVPEICAVWCNNDQPYGTVTKRWSKTY